MYNIIYLLTFFYISAVV